MKPEKVIVDWLNGYETPDQIQGTPVAFSTPHHMMHTPRNMEAQNTRIHYLTRSKDFKTLDEINAFLEFTVQNPYNMNKALDEADLKDEERDNLDYLDIIEQAYQSDGEKAMRLVLQSLLYSHQPIDALLWIANHLSKTTKETYQMLSMAVCIAEVTLDEKKRDSLMGEFWSSQEFRPFMRAKATFADYLFSNNTSQADIQKAIGTMEVLLEYDKQDHMGIRFLLMSIYSFQENFDKMEILNQRFPKDHQNPLFLYPMAYKHYRTVGPTHHTTQSFLANAVQSNPFVVTIILDDQNIPFYEGSSFHKHSIEEAYYFLNINYDYVEPDDRMVLWLSQAFQDYLNSKQKGSS